MYINIFKEIYNKNIIKIPQIINIARKHTIFNL